MVTTTGQLLNLSGVRNDSRFKSAIRGVTSHPVLGSRTAGGEHMANAIDTCEECRWCKNSRLKHVYGKTERYCKLKKVRRVVCNDLRLPERRSATWIKYA